MGLVVLAESGASIRVDQLIAFGVGLATGASALLGLADRRRKEVAETWKALAEAKTAEATDCDERLSAMEARLDLLQSDWVGEVATHVASAVVEAVRKA